MVLLREAVRGLYISLSQSGRRRRLQNNPSWETEEEILIMHFPVFSGCSVESSSNLPDSHLLVCISFAADIEKSPLGGKQTYKTISDSWHFPCLLQHISLVSAGLNHNSQNHHRPWVLKTIPRVLGFQELSVSVQKGPIMSLGRPLYVVWHGGGGILSLTHPLGKCPWAGQPFLETLYISSFQVWFPMQPLLE